MNAKTKNTGLLKNLIVIFILIWAGASVSGAEDVKIELSFADSRIEPGDDAVLKVEIENEEDYDISADVEIWAEEYEDDGDDLQLEDKSENIPAGETMEFEYTLNDLSSDWDAYRCASHTIRVEVENEEETITLRISGDDFRISVSPSDPSVSDEIKIIIKDDSGDELDNEEIRIMNLDTDDYITEDTDSDGEFSFTPDEESEFEDSPAGTYEIMVDNKENEIDGHCSTKKTFNVKYTVDKKDIVVVYPELPKVPKVNEQVTIEITTTYNKPARFANITVSGPKFSKNYQTNSNGLFYFIPESTGNYDIKLTDNRYSAVTKTIAVGEQTPLSISFSPEPPEIGKKLTIIVKADGKAVSGAEVTVTDPAGGKKSKTTDSSGEAEFDALKNTGKYEITAKKSDYADTQEERNVYKSLKVTVTDRAAVGDMVKVKVEDSNNDPVRDATVKGENFDLNEKTDGSGEVEFKIIELKDHSISIGKEGFTEVKKEIKVGGELIINLNPEKPQMNKEVIITIHAGNMEAAADIKILSPNGTEENIKESRYAFKPDQVGKYLIFVSKERYEDASLEFDIAYNLIELQYDVADGNLIFKVVTTDGKPVSGAEVGIYATTNEEGIAKLEFDNNYDVLVIKENYETKKGTIEVPGKRDYLKIIMGILILILILVIFILLLRENKKGKTGLKK